MLAIGGVIEEGIDPWLVEHPDDCMVRFGPWVRRGRDLVGCGQYSSGAMRLLQQTNLNGPRTAYHYYKQCRTALWPTPPGSSILAM